LGALASPKLQSILIRPDGEISRVVSNLNLSPWPREKVVYLSGVNKQTVARSDDDEFLFQVDSTLKHEFVQGRMAWGIQGRSGMAWQTLAIPYK
jgi:hypothetical protein